MDDLSALIPALDSLLRRAGAVAVEERTRLQPELKRDGSIVTNADRAIEDMTAVMEPGIAALLGVNARGADPRPAALALWREFTEARAGVMALLPPSGALGPRRSA